MQRIHPLAFAWALALPSSTLGCSGEAQVVDPEAPSAGAASMQPGPAMPTLPDGMPPDPAGSAGSGGSESAPDLPAPDGMGPDGMEPDEELPSGAEPDEPVTAPVAFAAPRGPCELSERLGGFSIEKQVEFGVVQGIVNDGVVPTAIPRLAVAEGACRLLERRTLACIPACVGAETCGEGGVCIPYPRQASVGDVTITGLTRETRMSPLTPGNTYFAPGADNPPYAVGAEIVLSAAGDGPMAAFQLFGRGSEPLAQSPRWQLEAGQDLSIEWPAPAPGVDTTVLVELTIDQHGASPLSLSCEFPDTGSALVPASLVDRMIDSGVTGFPNGRITRRSADHVDVSLGCVELVVGSPLAASIAVAGYTPCDGPEDCPSGQSCNVLLERCE